MNVINSLSEVELPLFLHMAWNLLFIIPHRCY